jgi:hypothetical protein
MVDHAEKAPTENAHRPAAPVMQTAGARPGEGLAEAFLIARTLRLP